MLKTHNFLFMFLIHQNFFLSNELNSVMECNVKDCVQQQNSFSGGVGLNVGSYEIGSLGSSYKQPRLSCSSAENLQFKGEYLALQSISLNTKAIQQYRVESKSVQNLICQTHISKGPVVQCTMEIIHNLTTT